MFDVLFSCADSSDDVWPRRARPLSIYRARLKQRGGSRGFDRDDRFFGPRTAAEWL
jgi:hypothetical protein